ncbi:protein RCC2-like [Lolium rigidum]|uniref:protein RCC2-like n=1 Tax=Lolium rigidum TaxID=89674 RepID=UPI001F5C7812|nr:protein RCC2-like [Lolium rigidum]
MPASAAAGVAAEGDEEKPAGRELLYCGTTRFDIMGRKVKGVMRGSRGNLVSPARLRPLVGVDIRFVASGCAACHCVALGADGRCFTWGRNEKGQLGHGDTLMRNLPAVVSELSKYNIISAGVGRNHTVVVTDDGKSFAFGDNKHGQLGTGSLRKETVVSPVPCLVTEATNAVCGCDFTVWLSSVEGSSILTAGLPQYGQLGHGSNNEYNTKVSSVKLSYDPQPRPRAVATLSGKTVVKVACGTNHTVAVDSSGFVYTWGFGGYGRLGHNEQKDEWQPRLVQIFQKNNILGPNDIISAGSASSACTAGGRGQLYMWGKLKNSGDEWMYPKPVTDLSGWNIRCMASGSMHHTVGADDSCISWGHSEYGELGYGSTQKSSVNPKKVDILEGMHVTSVGCGVGMSLIVVDRANVGDKIDQLDTFDGDSDALFQENLYFPPRRYSKEEQDTNTSQQHATHETEAERPDKATKKATPAANSRPNKRKTTVDHPKPEHSTDGSGEETKEVQRSHGTSTRRGRGRGAKTAATPEPMPSGRGRGRGRPKKGTGSP